jgi:hypothetical protein
MKSNRNFYFYLNIFFIIYFFFSLSHSQQPKHLTFRDILAFWQCYDQLYIEQYQYDRKYSTTVIDQAINSFGLSEYDILLSSPPRLPSYRRFNSQNEYERLFHEFSSVTNDELDACLSTNNDNNINNNNINKPGK